MRRAVITAAFVLAALLTFCATARADETLHDAISGQVADCATTAIALTGHELLVEANPLGPIVVCAVKPLLLARANALPEPDRTVSLSVFKSVGYGAAANNLITLAGALANLGTGPVGPIVGLIVGLWTWHGTEDERLAAAQGAQ